MSALRRVLAAPWLWLAIGALQLAIAAAATMPVRAVLRAAMGPFMLADEGKVLTTLLELVTAHPGVAAAFMAALVTSAALGLLLAPLLAGGVICRLDGRRGVGELARASVVYFPAMLVIGLYGLVLRLLLGLIAAALGTIHPTLQIVGVAVSLCFAALVVDLARARTVLDGARGLHPRTFIRALVSAAASPALCLKSGLLTALSWGFTLVILIVAVHGIASAWSPWAVRGLALLATFASLWRVAVAVEHRRPRDQTPV